MGAHPTAKDFARLRARVAELEAAPARRYRRHRARRLLPLALVALLVALVPLGAGAAISFNDLNPGSPHNANIQAIADAGITTGCAPGVSYCPNATVTREEMASFLARTAGLGTNPPVANAKTAQTATTATTATNAANADKVGGYAPNGLVRAAVGTNPGDVTLTGAGTFQTLATVTIIAPGAGVVLVDSTLSAFMFGTFTKLGFRLRDTTSGATSFVSQIYQSNTAAMGLASNPSPTHAFAVSAGGPRTFVLEGVVFFGADGCCNMSGATLTALYIPFAQDGGTTLAP